LLTFVVVGAGPTGVEMAGQLAELSHRTLRRDFRHIDPREARIILLDAAPTLLGTFDPRLQERSRAALEKMGIEVRLGAKGVDVSPTLLGTFDPGRQERSGAAREKMAIEARLGAKVVDVDAAGIELEDEQGRRSRLEASTKVWAAGVAASPLAGQLAEQVGVEVDRQGRIPVQPDLTLPGHPEVFVVGDMMALDNLPGVAQVAIQ